MDSDGLSLLNLLSSNMMLNSDEAYSKVNNQTTFSHRRKMKFLTIAITLFILFASPIGCNSQCTEERGCFPQIGNLAIGRTVSTESTCIDGTEYCIFLQSNECFPCSPNTTHSPSNINDNDEATTWISRIGPSISSTPVVLQLNLESEFLFDSMSIVFNSARPRTMILEYSRDQGATWEAYRYYSTTCMDMFGLSDTFVDENAVLDTLDPICTSSESGFHPFTGGLVS